MADERSAVADELGLARATAGAPHLAWIVALCVGALMLDGVDIQMMAFAAPLVLKEWGLERAALAPALAAALAGMVAGALVGGFIGDRLGRRPMILLSLSLAGLLTLAAGTSRGIEQMVVFRLLGGVGFGALYPNVFPLIGELSQAQSRSRVVILATIGTPLGGTLGALATGWAMPLVGWRPCFYAAGCLTFVLAIVMLRVLPESPSFLSGAQRLFSEAHRDKREPVPSSQRATRSLFAPEFARRTLGLGILGFSSGFVSYAFLSWVPVLLSRGGLPLGPAIIGSFFVNAFTVLGTFAMAAAVLRLGSRRSILIALAVFAVGSVALGICVALPRGAEARIVGIMSSLACVGLGLGATGSSLFMLAVELYPPRLRATGGGLANALARLGAVIVAFAGGAVLSQKSAGEWPFLIMVLVVLALAGLGTLLIDAHIPRRHPVPVSGRVLSDSL